MADIKDRITVVETVYHQSALSGETTVVESRFSRKLETVDQPYKRQLVATEVWTPLEFGWLEKGVSVFVVQNEAGKHLQKQPTEEEKKEIDQQVLLIGLNSNVASSLWVIPPGESMRGSIALLSPSLWIRCEKGSAPYILHAYPK